MSAINFPDPSQSPWTNESTGITYTYSNGVWKALSSEEVFLKESDAESTYLKQADANFVSLSDGGTQQVISGGGGLNVDGDVQKKGNTVPSAVMGASAPSNPGICDFWTDTSGDDPVLKSWNGTEWVEVGSSTPSEISPVISSVTLTENDTAGDRFTSQTFDVDITMLREGEPFSQKGLKGEVTAEFAVYPVTDPVDSNAVTTFPNTNKSHYTTQYPDYGAARVYAVNNVGKPTWFFLKGNNSYNLYLYESAPGQDQGNGEVARYNGSYGSFGHAVYIPNPGTHDYIYTASNNFDNNCHARAFKKAEGGGWESFDPGYEMSPPVYDDVYNVWWYSKNSGNSRTVRKGTTHLSSDLGESTTNGTTSSSGIIALGSDRVAISRRNSSSGMIYCDVYTRDAGTLQWIGAGTLSSGSSSCNLLSYARGVFFALIDGTVKRSTNGTSWTTIVVGNSDFNLEHIEDNAIAGLIEAYGYDYPNSKYEMWTSNNGGVTWVLAHEQSYNPSYNGYNVYVGGSKVIWHGYDNGYYVEDYYPRNEQTLTLSGTGTDYSSFNVGDIVRPEGSSLSSERGTIKSISGTSIGIESDYIYQVGDKLEAVFATNSAVSSRYLVIDATGTVSGTVGSDPGYVSVGPDTNQTLTFPATFPSGNAPDDELPAGTTFKVSAQATNSIGSSEFGPSNIITPA